MRYYGEALQRQPNNREAIGAMSGVLAELGAPTAVARLEKNPKLDVLAKEAGEMARWGKDVVWKDPHRRFEGTDAALARLNELLVKARAEKKPDHGLITRLRFDRVYALRNRERWSEVVHEVAALRAEGAQIPPYVREAEADNGTARSTTGHRHLPSKSSCAFTFASRAVMHYLKDNATDNAEGVESLSPGLRGTSHPGCAFERRPTLKGLNPHLAAKRDTTLSGLARYLNFPRVDAPASHQPWADGWNAVGVFFEVAELPAWLFKSRHLLFPLFLLFLAAVVPVRGADRYAVVGFHDIVDFRGDHSIYTRVFPLLLAYHIPAVFAIEGSWVDAPGNGTVNYGKLKVPRTNFVTWEEMREMSKSNLVEFASHTYDLHHGAQGNPQGNEFAAANSRLYTPGRGYETEAQFRQRVFADLLRSRELLASRLGKAPRAVVWPYGRYSGPALEEAKRAGFQYALTLDPEPANVHNPGHVGRYLPTNDPKVATLVSNIRFEDPLPRARRLVDLNPAAFWTGDQEGTNDRLGREIERLRRLGATGIVLDAVVVNGEGRIEAAWFPNGQIPMRADILSRLSWQCKARGNVETYLRLPSTAALRTLGSAAKVRRLFDELGAYVPATGLFIDDTPELARMEAHPSTGTPWDVRAARDAAIGHAPTERAALALSAFKAYEFQRPTSMLLVVGYASPTAGPSAIADVTLVPVAPRPRDVSRLVDQMCGLGWFAPGATRRGGLWFASNSPPKENDLNKATRLFQRPGGTVIGWSTDDLTHNLPKAAVVEPTVSASSFPVKF